MKLTEEEYQKTVPLIQDFIDRHKDTNPEYITNHFLLMKFRPVIVRRAVSSGDVVIPNRKEYAKQEHMRVMKRKH